MSEPKVLVGDLFKSRAQTLVNTVNCVGVMGKGVALGFKKRFPAMFADYVVRCKRGEVQLGRPYLYTADGVPWTLNFPTKDDWRSVSRLSDIVRGLEYLESHYKDWGITSLAVPPLGCGNGQLDWEVVGPTLFRHFSRLDIPVELYAPHDTPAYQLSLEYLAGQSSRSNAEPARKIGPAEVALVAVVSRIVREPYHWPVGRVTFQKMAYFLTEAGVSTGLEYERGSYGPFAKDLKRVTARLVNNGLLTETKRGQMFVIEPGPTYLDARERHKDRLREWAPEINKVADLFLRLSRTEDAEVAATVHFAAKSVASTSSANAPSELDVLKEVQKWKIRRQPPLRDEHIATTIRRLNVLSWLDIRPSHGLPVPEESFA